MISSSRAHSAVALLAMVLIGCGEGHTVTFQVVDAETRQPLSAASVEQITYEYWAGRQVTQWPATSAEGLSTIRFKEWTTIKFGRNGYRQAKAKGTLTSYTFYSPTEVNVPEEMSNWYVHTYVVDTMGNKTISDVGPLIVPLYREGSAKPTTRHLAKEAVPPY